MVNCRNCIQINLIIRHLILLSKLTRAFIFIYELIPSNFAFHLSTILFVSFFFLSLIFSLRSMQKFRMEVSVVVASCEDERDFFFFFVMWSHNWSVFLSLCYSPVSHINPLSSNIESRSRYYYTRGVIKMSNTSRVYNTSKRRCISIMRPLIWTGRKFCGKVVNETKIVWQTRVFKKKKKIIETIITNIFYRISFNKLFKFPFPEYNTLTLHSFFPN